MAFHQPTALRTAATAQPSFLNQSTPALQPQPSESQEWILFGPSSQAESSTQQTELTAGLSRVSELGYFNSVARSVQHDSVLDDDATEDAELDSLDDGLHAFREPNLYTTNTNQTNGPVLPAHDGLGSFQASSAPVLEQLWRHEQFNSKRKHEGAHRRSSSVQRHLDTIEEFDAQASEEKRLRIEKWRIEQSQALLEEVERETRRRVRRSSTQYTQVETSVDEVFGTTPKQSDYMSRASIRSPQVEEPAENEPFWRRITRKFIRDIIGIDEPLLSVILGESLPGEYTLRAGSPSPEADSSQMVTEDDNLSEESSWRDKLLQRIANELGVMPYQLNAHPGAFTTFSGSSFDYAGMPVTSSRTTTAQQSSISRSAPTPGLASSLGPNFPPTLRDDSHAESWGLEEEPISSTPESSLNLKKEREYWEKELDVKMVFRYLKDRFTSTPVQQSRPIEQTQKDNSAQRVAIIRQHHPLVSHAHRSATRGRRESRPSIRRPSSSCASESLKGAKRATALRSGSSRNYWDIGGSTGSGSVAGAWGQA